MRVILDSEMEQVSGGDIGGPIVVTAPQTFGFSFDSSGMGDALAPVVNFSAISSNINQVMAGLSDYLASLGIAGTGVQSAEAAPTQNNNPNSHTAPPGYHFGPMDPTGQHYMIKDGDPNNGLVITPWYQQKIDSQKTDWPGVASDLINIGVGAISGAGEGLRVVLGIGLGVYNFAFPK